MLLQCPLCRSQYRIQAEVEGRKVKCKKCTHVWEAQAKDIIEELMEVEQPIAVGDYPTSAQKQPPEPPKPSKPAEVVSIKSDEPADEAPAEEAAPTPEAEAPIEEAVVEPVTETPTAEEAQVEEVNPEAREYPRARPAVDPEGEGRPRFAAKHIEKEKKSSLVGLSVTILIVGLFVTAVLMGRTQIVRHWPAAALMYDMVGLHVPVIGEGLHFENIKTSYDKDVEGESIILLQGEIKNISNEEKSIPLVAIKPFDEKNTGLSKAKVKIRGDVLKPGESAKFSAQVPASTTLDPQDKFVFIDG